MDAESPEISLRHNPPPLGGARKGWPVARWHGRPAAEVVVHLLGLISNLALPDRFGWQLPDLRRYHPTPVAVAVGGALAVVGLGWWSPIIKGHGIP